MNDGYIWSWSHYASKNVAIYMFIFVGNWGNQNHNPRVTINPLFLRRFQNVRCYKGKRNEHH